MTWIMFRMISLYVLATLVYPSIILRVFCLFEEKQQTDPNITGYGIQIISLKIEVWR
jgi:hypothetical protein